MNKRTQLLTWQQQGRIKDIDKSLEVTGATIEPKTWFDFISKNLIILGFVSLALGIIFFFAYNWDEMTKMAKFILVQALLGLSAVFYTQTQKHSHTSTGILLFMALLIGALLALFGQTYQTGKDPWQLFLLWTVFVTPLAVVSKNSVLWVLWLALMNLTVYLYLDVYRWFSGFLFSFNGTSMVFALINSLAALMFYFVLKTPKSLSFYVAILSAFFAFTWVGFFAMFDSKLSFAFICLYLLWMALNYFLFKVKTLDVLVLSAWSLSAIAFIMFALTRLFADAFNAATLLFFSIALIAMTAIASKWLMQLLKQSHGELS